jgi:hypothetical protein
MVEHPGEYRWSSYGHNLLAQLAGLFASHLLDALFRCAMIGNRSRICRAWVARLAMTVQ